MKNSVIFSSIIARILERSKTLEHLTCQYLMDELHEKGALALIFAIALIFSSPIVIPGLSTPFGFAVTLLGARIMCGLSPWLPSWFLKKEISHKTFEKTISWMLPFLRWLEKGVHPRWDHLGDNPAALRLHGFLIMLQGLVLGIPLPLPLLNMVGAVPLLILSIGLLENDGLYVVIGYIACILSMILMGALLGFGAHLFW